MGFEVYEHDNAQTIGSWLNSHVAEDRRINGWGITSVNGTITDLGFADIDRVETDWNGSVTNITGSQHLGSIVTGSLVAWVRY